MALCKKQIKTIGVPRYQAKAVEVDRATDSAMNTAKIDHELIIDKHPQVIITRKVECLSCLVGKVIRQLQCVMIVVRVAIIRLLS
jgi:hypothetical protein